MFEMQQALANMPARQGLPQRVHGGTDQFGKPQFDFSTNSNALGPCRPALAQIQLADCSAYPDPEYQALRQTLAEWHQVEPQRILFAASASEFIYRMSVLVAFRSKDRTPTKLKQGIQKRGKLSSLETTQAENNPHSVWVPPHSYGDYALAARSVELSLTAEVEQAALAWACEPSSPLGQNQRDLPHVLEALSEGAQLVLDCAYQPLRLSGRASLNEDQLTRCWQLFTPNKALGLTGIRGAYVIAPVAAEEWQLGLEYLAPSWVLGVHAVAMLNAWCSAPVQAWLRHSLDSLREWKHRQMAICRDLGWQVHASHANFFCASPGEIIQEHRRDFLHALRAQGIKLRHAESFGLPACFRMGVLHPLAQDAFQQAVQQFSPEFI